MNETTKTATMIGLGAALLIAGIYFLPSRADFTTESKVGEVLFPDLLDGNKAAGMEIVSFDEKLSKLSKFAVKNLNGRWVLPSHNNYPADAKQQLVDAASSLVNLKALSEAKDVNPEQYEIYGVLDPTDEKVQVGSTGVGKLVIFTDGSSKTLAKLIIGKQPSEQGHTKGNNDLRYVRIAGQAPIYTVKLAADKFSPKFEDWIETKLLELNEFDIREVMLRDYVFRPENQTDPIPKSVALLKFDDQGAQWTLEKMIDFLNGMPHEIQLTKNDELNTAKLDELKTALNDLKIVNVIRKPQGLINMLRGEGAGLDEEGESSLASRGFYLVPVDKGFHLMSRDGEVGVSLRDGVEYTLRFGNFANALPDLADTEQENKDPTNAAPKPKTMVNRYLMVEARFNPDLIPKPMLEEVPPEASSAPEKKPEPKPEDSQAPETKPADDPKSDTAKSDTAKSDTAKPDTVKPEPTKQPAEDKAPAAKEPSKGPAPKKDDKQSSLNESPFRTAAFQSPAKDAPKKDDAPAATESEKPEPKAPETKSAESKDPEAVAAEPKAAEPRPAEIKPVDANDPKNPNFERNLIIRRNETALKDYDKKIQAGQFRAKQLNERFAEWYYVIPDEVYKKIHLSKNDIITLKPAGGAPANPLQVPNLPFQPGFQPGFPPPGLMPGGK